MYIANRGKTAPKMERRKVFAAIAEAALFCGKKAGGLVVCCNERVEQRRIGGMSTRGKDLQHQVCVNEVIQRLQKNAEETEAGHQTRQSWHDPMHVSSISRPAEPEKAQAEGHAADDGRWKAPFRNGNAIVRRELSVVVTLGEDDICASQQHPEHHPEVREAADTGIEAVNLLENDRIGCKE